MNETKWKNLNFFVKEKAFNSWFSIPFTQLFRVGIYDLIIFYGNICGKVNKILRFEHL